MVDADLKGSVALVTGGSLGIGRATCIALARAGAQVAVNYRSHADEAEQVVQAVRDSGSRAIKVQADVADQQAVDEMVARSCGTSANWISPSAMPPSVIANRLSKRTWRAFAAPSKSPCGVRFTSRARRPAR